MSQSLSVQAAIALVKGDLSYFDRPNAVVSMVESRFLRIRLSRQRWVLMLRLVRAAIHAADRSGIGSDRVWEIAREIKRLRQ